MSSTRVTRRTMEMMQTLRRGRGSGGGCYQGGGLIAYKKPRAKTPMMAYFCLLGRLREERTGIYG